MENWNGTKLCTEGPHVSCDPALKQYNMVELTTRLAVIHFMTPVIQLLSPPAHLPSLKGSLIYHLLKVHSSVNMTTPWAKPPTWHMSL